MKLIQTTRQVNPRESTPSNAMNAVIQCGCKWDICTDCQGCIKCQCECGGPQRKLRRLNRRTSASGQYDREVDEPRKKSSRKASYSKMDVIGDDSSSEKDNEISTRKRITRSAVTPTKQKSTTIEKKRKEIAIESPIHTRQRRTNTNRIKAEEIPSISARSRRVAERFNPSEEIKTPKTARNKRNADELKENIDRESKHERQSSKARKPHPSTTSTPKKEKKQLILPVLDESIQKVDEELDVWLKKCTSEQEELINLEKQIYQLEGAYLRRSQHAGNIIKGYANADVFITEMIKDETTSDEMTPAIEAIVNTQRIFSYSSMTSPAEVYRKELKHCY